MAHELAATKTEASEQGLMRIRNDTADTGCMLNADHDRKMQDRGRSARKTKKPPPETETESCLIVTRKEEITLSLAGLAATYSPRA